MTGSATSPDDGRSHVIGLHHVGVVVADVDAESRSYVEGLGYTAEGAVIHEVAQRVLVRFLRLGQARVELIQPEGDGSPMRRLREGGGQVARGDDPLYPPLHLRPESVAWRRNRVAHLCYESDDIEATIRFFRLERGMIPTWLGWSCSMDSTRVAFCARPDGEVVELIQRVVGGPTAEQARELARKHGERACGGS